MSNKIVLTGNDEKFNDLGFKVMEEYIGKFIQRTDNEEWLLEATLDNLKVYAFPISSINALAPPHLWAKVDGEYQGEGIDNNESTTDICNQMGYEYEPLVELIKLALKAISK